MRRTVKIPRGNRPNIELPHTRVSGRYINRNKADKEKHRKKYLRNYRNFKITDTEQERKKIDFISKKQAGWDTK